MRLLYPLIASALITITPFLATFEKGQNIVRGLFSYEEFAILLFFVLFKRKLTKKTHALLLVALTVALFYVAWIDLQNLLAIKGWTLGWYGLLPFATCVLALAIVWKAKPFSFNGILFILFVSLIAHLFSLNNYAAQPLAQFPVIDYLERTAPKPPQRKQLSDEWAKKYAVTDSVTITRDYVDTLRSNVMILIESWGVPLDTSRFSSELKIFEGIPQTVGIHNRMYSRTRTAEREDLIFKIHRDSTGRRDTTFLPQIFAKRNYQTTFLFGDDSLEHQRFKYINKIGFNNALYGYGLKDNLMSLKIDSLLADTTHKHFIAWTTGDTKFPMEDFPDIYNSDADVIDSAYSYRLEQTLSLIAELAKKHPSTRFIFQGDHNPILSPVKFQDRFYKRWVPFVILN
ncbi:hypothetical protein [Fibrobacter succinogenes]|uniref:hypothetical protein n=1 Tax=Fibrobacter succinogenes TaxID=833 RepID=UPI0026EDB739|nr:hypothetical protein [Fibrobacter succinogenes]